MIDRLYTIDEINEYLNKVASPQHRAALAGIVDNAIGKDNHKITYNINSNSFSGVDMIPYVEDYFGGTGRAGKNLAGRSANWSNRQARRNSDFHVFNSSAALLAGMPDYFKKKQEEADRKATEENVLQKINDPDGFYGLDESGSIIFLNDFANAESKRRYSRVIEALNNGVTGYNLSEWGNDKNLGGMLQWWQDLSPETREYYSADNMWDRLSHNTADADDWSFLQSLGAVKGTNSGGSDPDFYVPEGSAPNVAVHAKNAGVKFEKYGDRDRIIDPTGRYYNMMGRGVPFLIGTKYEDGGIGQDGILYTHDEVAAGNSSEIGMLFDPFGSASANSPTFQEWLAMSKGGIKTMWDKDISGFDNAGYQFFNHTTHHTPDLWGMMIDGWQTGDAALRDDTPFYEYGGDDSITNFQVINYIVPGEYDELGFPKTKFRVIYEKNNAVKYKDFESEEELLDNTEFPIRRKNSKWSLKSKYVTLSELKSIDGKNYYQSETVELKGGVKVAIYRKQGETNRQRYYLDGSGNLVAISTSKWNILKNPAEAKKYSTISKEGGTIPKIKPLPKYYTGGAVRYSGLKLTDSFDVTTENNPEAATHTMTNTGNLVKDLKTAWKYDFTDAEKLLIEGAIVDLAGVAVSFIPGAHLASAVTGVAGTAMTFWGDVKKDGFQWGDLWRGLGSLAMDVGTVFTGSVAKTAKVIKVVKAAAKPIMKLLTAAGILNGTVALAKLARGEDVTSDDLIDILRGITSTAIGSKMLKQKVGDATLAKKIENEVLKTQNADIKTTPKAKIEGKDIELSKAEVNANIKGKTKTQVEEYLQGKVKQELGENYDPTKHGQELSEKFGVQYDKGETEGIKLRNIFKKGESVLQRGESRAKFIPQQPGTGSWWLTHFFRPGVRNKYLGYDWGFWQSDGHLSSISRGEFDAARMRLAEGSGPFYQRWADQALMQHSMANPNAFSFEFDDASTNYGFSWGRPIYGRNPSDPYAALRGGSDIVQLDASGNPIVYRSFVTPYVQQPIQDTRRIIGTDLKGNPIYESINSHLDEVDPNILRRRAKIQEYKFRRQLFPQQNQLLLEEPSPEAMLHYRHQEAVPIRTEAAYGRHQLPEQGPIQLGGKSLSLVPTSSQYVSVVNTPGQPIRGGVPTSIAAPTSVPLSQTELANVNSLVTNYAKLGGSPDDVYSYVAQMLYSKGYKPTSQMVEQVVNAAQYMGYLKKGGKIQYSRRGSVLKYSGGAAVDPDKIYDGVNGIKYKIDGDKAYEVDADGNWKESNGARILYDPTIQVSPLGILYKTDSSNNTRYEVNTDGSWVLDDDGNKIPADYEGTELEAAVVTVTGPQKTVIHTSPRDEAENIYANPVGIDNTKKPGTGISKPLGKTAAVVAGHQLASSGLKQQQNNVDNLRVPYYTTEFEFYTPFRNSSQAFFEQEKNRIMGQTRHDISADPNKNWAFRQSASDTVHRLSAQQADSASSEYDNWLKTNVEEQRQYASNRSSAHNAGIDASLKLDTTKAAYDSKLIGEQVKNTQLAAADLAQIWDGYVSKRDAFRSLEFQWDWEEWRNKVGQEYVKARDASLASNPDKPFPTINEWIRDHVEYSKDYRGLMKRQMSLKKGGKVRPLHEQLQIDSNKARDKELAQLSKQAHDLLKTLLS